MYDLPLKVLIYYFNLPLLNFKLIFLYKKLDKFYYSFNFLKIIIYDLK